MARELGVEGSYIDAAIAIEGALEAATGRRLPINIDGVYAAILAEIDFPVELANAVFIASRMAGVMAHVAEELASMPPMRRIDPAAHSYGGPPPRPVPTARFRMSRTVAQQLVDYLSRRGVTRVFGLCGHTNIAVLAAMADSAIEFVNVRHEQIAAHAADGYARVTGRASVLLSHLSPGLTNCATGVANAALDCIPMVVIAGDVPTHYYGKHPHQEVNLHADAAQHEIYRPFVKRAWRVDTPELLPEIVDKAFALAESGQPGPVLVDVPMDVFSAEIDPALFERLDHNTKLLVKPSIDDEIAVRIVDRLAESTSPVLYVGGGIHLAGASEELERFIDHMGIPLAHSLMGKGAVSDAHPLVLGMTGFWGTALVNDACLGADTVLAIGTRFKEADSSSWYRGFTFDIPDTQAHPHRHRAQRDRPELPDRDRRRRRCQIGAPGAEPGGPGTLPGWVREPGDGCQDRRIPRFVRRAERRDGHQ